MRTSLLYKTPLPCSHIESLPKGTIKTACTIASLDYNLEATPGHAGVIHDEQSVDKNLIVEIQ